MKRIFMIISAFLYHRNSYGIKLIRKDEKILPDFPEYKTRSAKVTRNLIKYETEIK